MAEAEYSFSLTTFSPSGKLMQIEHALQTVSRGDPSLGIKAKNGVVIATEKKVPNPLMDETTFKKIENMCSGVGAVYAGMPADYKVLLRKGRKRAQNYKAIYGDDIPCSQMTRELADIMQEFTQSGGVRPFGVSMMVAGYDSLTNTPQLYQVDPSGTYFGWKASAIGKNFKNMKTFLEKRLENQLDTIDIEDAIHIAILTLKEGFEGEMSEDNIEIGVIRANDPDPSKNGVFQVLGKDEVRDLIQEGE